MVKSIQNFGQKCLIVVDFEALYRSTPCTLHIKIVTWQEVGARASI